MNRRNLLAAAAALVAGTPFLSAFGATSAIAEGAAPLIPVAAPVVQQVLTGGVGPSLALSLNLLDEAIDAVDGPTHLVMSKRMRNLLSQGSRLPHRPGYITWDKNERGERVAFYSDLPIIVTDYDVEGGQIIDYNEGDDNTTSIYVLADSDEVNQTVAELADSAEKIEREMPAAAINSMSVDKRTDYYHKRRTSRAAAEEALNRKLIALAPVRVSGIGKAHVVD